MRGRFCQGFNFTQEMGTKKRWILKGINFSLERYAFEKLPPTIQVVEGTNPPASTALPDDETRIRRWD